jgi:hypothetical protein
MIRRLLVDRAMRHLMREATPELGFLYAAAPIAVIVKARK